MISSYEETMKQANKIDSKGPDIISFPRRKKTTIGFRREFCRYATETSIREACNKYPEIHETQAYKWVRAYRDGIYDNVPADFVMARRSKKEAAGAPNLFSKEIERLREENKNLIATLAKLIEKIRG